MAGLQETRLKLGLGNDGEALGVEGSRSKRFGIDRVAGMTMGVDCRTMSTVHAQICFDVATIR
jgi:hypothetical protein